MTDDGLKFYATMESPSGEQWHRETPSRAELVEWIALHQSRGRLVKIAMEATTDTAARNMFAAIVFGGVRLTRAEGESAIGKSGEN